MTALGFEQSPQLDFSLVLLRSCSWNRASETLSVTSCIYEEMAPSKDIDTQSCYRKIKPRAKFDIQLMQNF